MKRSLLNILWLGLKEIRSLLSDMVMVAFVIYAFTLATYIQATGTSSEVNNASIGFVDEDGSILSKEIFNAFFPPRFKFPVLLGAEESQRQMDAGKLMFVVVVPPRFERELLGGLSAVWKQFLMVTAVGMGFFFYSLGLFRKSIAVSK